VFNSNSIQPDRSKRFRSNAECPDGFSERKGEEMGIKTWDKVSLFWDCYGMGLPTSLGMDGNFDPNLINPTVSNYIAAESVHGLFGVRAVSLPRDGDEDQRKGSITLDIRRKWGPNIPPNTGAVVTFLDARLNNRNDESQKPNLYGVRIVPPMTKSWTDTVFTLNFVLANREQFCDTAIEIVRGVFEGLGIHDQNGHHLARFELTRESYVEIDGAWITFPRWLRMSHRLPIWGPEGRQ